MDESKIIDAEHRSEMWDKADNARNEEAHLRNEVFELINALEYAYDELARIRCDYQADKQRFLDRARELSDEKERVKELELALDKPRSYLWFELTNERVKHRSVKESNRLLHTVYEEQCARASEYYNEMMAEKERADKLQEAINQAIKEYGLWNDKAHAADVMVALLAEVRSSLYPKEGQHEHLQK